MWPPFVFSSFGADGLVYYSYIADTIERDSYLLGQTVLLKRFVDIKVFSALWYFDDSSPMLTLRTQSARVYTAVMARRECLLQWNRVDVVKAPMHSIIHFITRKYLYT